MIKDIDKRTWAEINLKNAEYNFNQIKASTNAKICCVVKADAYGHGAVKLSKLYQKLGASYLAVSNLKEGIDLRKQGVSLPILIMGYTPIDCIEKVCEYDLTLSIFSPFYAKKIIDKLNNLDLKIKAHIKIDSGMNRLGFNYKDDLDEVYNACKCSRILAEGIFTHFCVADEGDSGKRFTRLQFERFTRAIKRLEQMGITFALKHCSNSAGILDFKDTHLDMVRAGISLYGCLPSNQIQSPIDLKPVMTLKTVISQIKRLSKGDFIGYGKEFRVDKKMTVATLPIGYADGFFRSGRVGFLAIKNTPVKILGRVCMDQLMIDVSGVDCKVGDEVIVFGRFPTASFVAKNMDTISYELFCSISKRVPRIYV